MDEIQLDLFLGYAGNVALYTKFQEYFAKTRPFRRSGAENDPFFLSSGRKEAFSGTNPNAERRLFYDPAISRWKPRDEIGLRVRSF